MTDKLKLAQCPGCGTPCELTAEYAGGQIVVSVSACGKFKLDVYPCSIICRNCGLCVVVGELFGVPSDTSVVVHFDSPANAPITNLIPKGAGR